MPGNQHDRLAGAHRRSATGMSRAVRHGSLRNYWGDTISRRRFIAAAGVALLALTRTAVGRTDAHTRYLTALMRTLAPEIEALTERVIPADWELLHACLYYAMAGQYLLALRGIATRLKGGVVVYYPDTPMHHRIKPHVWLETATHFIDSSALPRWGYIVVLPLQEVARGPASLMPGTSRVLILEERDDREFSDYVARHRARFERVLRGMEPDRD